MVDNSNPIFVVRYCIVITALALGIRA